MGQTFAVKRRSRPVHWAFLPPLLTYLALAVGNDVSAARTKTSCKVVKKNDVSTFLSNDAHVLGKAAGASAKGYSEAEGPKLKDLYATGTLSEFVDVYVDLVNNKTTNGRSIDQKGRYVIETKLAKYVQRAFEARGGQNGGRELTILTSKMKKELGVRAKLNVSLLDLNAHHGKGLLDQTGTDITAWTKGNTVAEMLEIAWRELSKLSGGTRHSRAHSVSGREGRGYQLFVYEHEPLMKEYLRVRSDRSLDEDMRAVKLDELATDIIGPWSE